MGGFPGGSAVKNLPCNAGDVGSIPGQGTKIPRATTKPPHRNYEVCAPQLQSLHPGAHGPQLERPCAATKDPMRYI